MEKRTIEAFIQARRTEMDLGLPGVFGIQTLERALARLPHADALEIQILCDRPLMDTQEPSAGAWACVRQQLDGGIACDGLESFILGNREAFDDVSPNMRIWAGIEQALPAASAKKPSVIVFNNWWKPLARMAASLTILVAGVGLGMWYSNHQNAQQSMSMSEVSHEYAELERYYQAEITSKSNQLAQFTGSQSADVSVDLEQLDHIMNELKAEMANVPPGNREQVVRAMIENYKTKTTVLQRVLEGLEHPVQDEKVMKDKKTKNI